MNAHWQKNDHNGVVLVLGCGRRPHKGCVNHDRVKHAKWVDIAFNLDQMPWPVEEATADVIIAEDVVEHLVDPYGFVNEAHRALRRDGLLVMRVAAWDNPASYKDLTHRHWCNEESMDFFDPTTPVGAHYRSFHPADSLGRTPTHWRIERVERVNADARWPDRGDIQFTMRAVK